MNSNELAEMQEKLNKLYEENDCKLNDEILEKQLEINKLRNETDIPDRNEMIFEEFVQ